MSIEQENPAASDPVERFTSAFWRLHRHLRSGALQERGQSITRVQWLILRDLRRSEPCAIGQLAVRMDVRPSTMSQMLDRLEKERWVERTPAPDDSRVRLVQLTEKGRTFMHAVEAVWQARVATLLSTLTEPERTTLTALLHKLADAAPREQGR